MGGCDEQQLHAAASALRRWALRSWHVAAPWYSRVLTPSRLLDVHACTHNPSAPTSPRDVLILVRVHPSRASQAAAVRWTWVARARALGAHVVLFAARDEVPASIAPFTVPDGPGGGREVVELIDRANAGVAYLPPRHVEAINLTAGANPKRTAAAARVVAAAWMRAAADPIRASSPGGLDDALFSALQWAQQRAGAESGKESGAPPTPRWVLAVTDETWVNADEAVASLRWLEWRVPLIVAHAHSGRMHPTVNDLRTHPSLDGGVFLTLPAIRTLLGAAGGRSGATVDARRRASSSKGSLRSLGDSGAQGHAPLGCAFHPAVRAPAATRDGLAALFDAASQSAASVGPSASPVPEAALAELSSRLDTLDLPLDAGQVLGRCAQVLGVPLVHNHLQWDTFDHSTTRSFAMDRNAVPLQSVATVARLGAITQRRGGRNATAKGGESMWGLSNATAEKYAPLGTWHPHAHDGSVIKDMPRVDPWSVRYPAQGSEAWAGLGECPPEGLAHASETLREWARRAHHPTARLHGRVLFPSQLAALHPCTTNTARPSTPSDFVIVVMATLGKNVDRLTSIREGWVSQARAAGATVLLVTETSNATLGTIAVSGAAPDGSYASAQNRSLFGLKYAVASHPSARWYWLVDDDTHVNIDVVADVMRYSEWRLPAVYGYAHHGNMRWTNKWVTYMSGGAGILLPRPAAEELAASIFTPDCPGGGLNDVVLGRCAWARGIPPVHINHMQPELDTSAMDDWVGLASVHELGAVASIHRVFPAYTATWIHRDLGAVKSMARYDAQTHKAVPDGPFDWRLPTPMHE